MKFYSKFIKFVLILIIFILIKDYYKRNNKILFNSNKARVLLNIDIKIDINKSSIEMITIIPYIGKKKAVLIDKYRKGKMINSINELRKIIKGRGILKSLKKYCIFPKKK